MAELKSMLLNTEFLELSLYTWALITAFVLISVIISRIASSGMNRFIFHFFSQAFPDSSYKKQSKDLSLSTPLQLILNGWFLLIGLSFLTISESLFAVFLVSAKVITYFGIVWAGLRFSELVQLFLTEKARKTDTKFDDLLAPLVGRSIKIVITLVGILSIAEILKLPLASLLTGLGIGGLAVAMAAKDAIANFFGSLTVVADRPFNIGDWVKINDIEGSVETLGFRSTRIRTFYNSLVTVPNSLLLTSTVDNMGEREYRRFSTKLTVTYNTEPSKLESFCEGIRDIIRNHPSTRKDYFFVQVNGFSESSIDILLYVFFSVPDWGEELKSRHDLLLSILKLAEKSGVSFAYPTQSLHIESSTTKTLPS